MTRKEELNLQKEWLKKYKVTLIPPVTPKENLSAKSKRRKHRTRGKYK